MHDLVVALCTCPDSDCAERIATALVTEKLAACVTRIAGARSTYMWEGKLQHDTEVLLLIKTKAEHMSVLKQRLPELHPYDVPELIALSITDGADSYLQWVQRSTSGD